MGLAPDPPGRSVGTRSCSRARPSLSRIGAFLLLLLFLGKLAPEDFGILAVIAVIGAFQLLIGTSHWISR